MINTIRRTAVALALAGVTSCSGNPRPQPPTPPPSPPPPPVVNYFPELLVRQPSAPHLIRGGVAWKPFGAVQCCMPAPPQVGNSRWPLASESWMDYTKADLFHFRMGPFYGDAEHESEWADIGGPYIGDGPDWNSAFWKKVVELIEHAGKAKAVVEVVDIDTWYCKHAASNWNDQKMPWPQADIDACGISASPEQERFIRKVVSELGCYQNVIWLTDNEGGEIRGTKRAWYEWNAGIIRDEEQKSGCGVIHMVGTNNTDFCDGPFDYCATHAREPLTTAIAGKHTENNERNPQFSVEQEFSNFRKARDAGLNYWYWRAEQTDEQMDQTLKLFRGEDAIPVGCFAPDAEDPLWINPPVAGGGAMRSVVAAGEAAVGEHCGTDHQGSLATLGLLAAELRKQGYCASGPWADALAILTPTGKWEEYHAVSFATGCWAQDPAALPKNTWTYQGTNPTSSICVGDVPTVDEIVCKLHQAGQGLWDCTPKAHGQPIRPEGNSERLACEIMACGGAAPAYLLTHLPGSALELKITENVFQFRVIGSGSGVVTCTTPSSNGDNLCLAGGQQPLKIER